MIIKNELKTHREAKIKPSDQFMSFLSWLTGCLFPFRCWSKRDKLTKLYEKGEEKLEAALDVVKIIKNLRNIKILMENSMMDSIVKKKLAHSF